jgi:hypothetical protein
MAGVHPSDAEARAAVLRTGYVYSDPVGDARFPGITAVEPNQVRDVPPPSWGLEPTARDQAAIDAGNA